MKEQRVKVAENIFTQSDKSKKIPDDALFDEDVIDMSDISDNQRYYGGILFLPSVAASYCLCGRKRAAADAAYCYGIGPQSYETTFEAISYLTNTHLLPILFAHFIGPENYTFWKKVFEECRLILRFDIPEETNIFDR